jgi:hypothetical protein
METTKQVTTKKTTKAVATNTPMSMGNFDATDFVIPRINLIQKMSKKNDGKAARYGELRESLDNKLLGDMETPMEFIPIHGEKKWVVSKRDEKGRYQFESTDAYDGPRDFFSPDKSVKNMLSYEFYVLLPSDIAKGEDMPYVISFQSTSSGAGKKLVTQMYMRNLRAGKPVYAAVSSLTVTEQTTDDNTYGVMDVSVARESTKEELEACAGWARTIASGAARTETEHDV